MPSRPRRVPKLRHISLMLLILAAACCPCKERDATSEKKPASVVGPGTVIEPAPPLPPPAAGLVRCEATLVSVQSHPWHQRVSDGQGGDSVEDGVSPLATFRLTAPAGIAGRTVGVLFKYGQKTAAPAPSDAGKKFTLDLPRAFLDGTFATLDNDQVKNLRTMESPHGK